MDTVSQTFLACGFGSAAFCVVTAAEATKGKTAKAVKRMKNLNFFMRHHFVKAANL